MEEIQIQKCGIKSDAINIVPSGIKLASRPKRNFFHFFPQKYAKIAIWIPKYKELNKVSYSYKDSSSSMGIFDNIA